MRTLITSGGTIVKIDDVRHIGNFSTGSFPAKIAEVAIAKGHTVFYLHAKNSKMPKAHRNLTSVAFETYDEYARALKNILTKHAIDVAFLGAAVSDYGVTRRAGKIASAQPSLTLRLYRLPKIIASVKRWSKTPLFQVGFKLASHATDAELVEQAYISGLDNRSDLTIANDRARIASGHREVILITPERGAIRFTEPNLAKKIISFVEARARTRHFKTVQLKHTAAATTYKKEASLFRALCTRMRARGFMPDFFSGASSGHGSIALRVSGDSFLITARGSNKKNLRPSDVVLVRNVDWRKRTISIEAVRSARASFNAVLVAAIFKKFPHINAVVHGHVLAKHTPTTAFPYTPGTLEYATKPLHLFTKGVRMINLKDHGLVVIGRDLEETVRYALR